MGKYLEDSYK